MITCKHSISPTTAHSGDVMWSLGYLRSLGKQIVFKLDVLNDEGMFDECVYNNLSEIVERQPYIDRVERYIDGTSVDIDLDTCDRYDLGICLYDAYHNISNIKPSHSDLWLYNGDQEELGLRNKIIYRNTRYRNNEFDWSYYIKNNINIDECFFVGVENEYISFLIKSKTPRSMLPWRRTNSMSELYDVVCSCSHFYGNAGLPAVMAQGFQKPLTLENPLPTSYGNRPNRYHLINHNVMHRGGAEYYLSYNKDNISKVPTQSWI